MNYQAISPLFPGTPFSFPQKTAASAMRRTPERSGYRTNCRFKHPNTRISGAELAAYADRIKRSA